MNWLSRHIMKLVGGTQGQRIEAACREARHKLNGRLMTSTFEIAQAKRSIRDPDEAVGMLNKLLKESEEARR